MEELFEHLDNYDFFTVNDAIAHHIGDSTDEVWQVFDIFEAYMNFWNVEGF